MSTPAGTPVPRNVRKIYTGEAPGQGAQPSLSPSLVDALAAQKAFSSPVSATPSPLPDVGATSAVRKIDDENAERLLVDLKARLGPIVTTADAISLLAERERNSAKQQRRDSIQQRRSDAEAARQRENASAQEWAQQAGEQARQRVRAAVQQLAPDAAAGDWSQWQSWASGEVPLRPPSWFRFGSFAGPVSQSGAVPALAPFLNQTGWFVQADQSASVSLIQQTILRLVSCVPLRHMRVLVYDPALTGAMGVFAPLRAANSASFPTPMTDAHSLSEALVRCAAQATSVGESLSARGVPNLAELWAANGSPDGDFTAIVVLDYPNGIDEAAQNLLIRLAQSGPRRGVSLLIQQNNATRPESDRVRVKDLLAHLTPITLVDNCWDTGLFAAGLRVQIDAPPNADQSQGIIQAAIARAASDSGPLILLSQLLSEDVAMPWTHDATKSVEAILGKAGDDLVTLQFRTADPPTANMLMGGAVGTGKSNVLLDVIYSLAARYDPDDLRFLLLDFKNGLEFKRFDADEHGAGWLPHVDVLSLESSQAFGLAILRHVNDLFDERAKVFKKSGVASIDAFRAATGKTMPRILLIIDEFQKLFDGDSDATDSAVAMLDNLARQGRVYGIHLLLASQTLSGVSGFRTKGEGIFAQFALRASLKNTAAESEAILSPQNRAASELRFRGEMILNRNFGLNDPSEPSNERVVAAFAEPAFTHDLQVQLWQKKHGDPPKVFLSRDWASWPSIGAPDGEGQPLAMWLGRPISVNDDPWTLRMDASTDQAVAIVGSGDELLASTLGAMIKSACAVRQAGGPLRIVLLDGVGIDTTAYSWCSLVLDYARSEGIEVEVVPRSQVTQYLMNTLKPMATAADGVPQPNGLTLVVALGLQRVPGMMAAVSPDPDSFEIVTPADALRDVATQGALRGIFLIGVWSNLRGLSEHLGPAHDGIGAYVLLTLGQDDRRDIIGSSAHPVDGFPRITLFDRRETSGDVTLVPFAPPQDGVN